jgi:hypothetical protein
MSGIVAERLFNLLPPRMPLSVKYQIVEGLWKHVGSKHRIRVGPDASLEQVVEAARAKIIEFVVNYKIPEDIERRFEWLAAGDVSIKQMLLSHVQEVEKSVVVEAVRAQVPVMLEHLRCSGSHTGRLAQIVRVGKHELELLMDKMASGVRVEYYPGKSIGTKNFDRVIPLPAAIGLLLVAAVILFIAGYKFNVLAGSSYSHVPKAGDTQVRRTDLSGPVRVIDGDTHARYERHSYTPMGNRCA